ncbi:MAG TPA: malto-oligosyltrehalose trehalohydrolase [Gemmatimonadaceae bacterium]|jgi:maltooligosyltrehalose trehalohydrolase
MARSPSTIAPISLRRYPVGVEVIRQQDGSTTTHARVWAPAAESVEVVIYADSSIVSASLLEAEGNGYFSGDVRDATVGSRYRFRLGADALYPDPASRYQPEGPHGPSVIVDSSAYDWADDDWRGVSLLGQVIYELHVGTFTKAGTFRGAIERLPDLVDIGVTVIEIMPLADFAGNFGWGYDGVNLYAPCRLYGTPDDLRALIDAAHQLELAVILDVVYNHFGPDGNYLTRFAPRYFSGGNTDWGEAINFDGDDAAPVREYYIANARYWIEEFHFDGLRLDATQQIYDATVPHILAEVAATVREAAGERRTIVVGENEPQDVKLLEPANTGGAALDGLWNDDLHHSAYVAATGRDEAYYSGYRGSAQELVSAAKYGFLYQGEWYAWQEAGRGTPSIDVHPSRLIVFIQNHDQVANTSGGLRLHLETSPGRYRALTALLLLLPQTPMLFQGQEFAASSPFLYFADHSRELASTVRNGRLEFLAQFPSVATPEGAAVVADPGDPRTFIRCKLDWSERRTHGHAVALHRDLLRLRREDRVLRAPRLRGVDGAVINDRAFMLRFFGGAEGDRLLLVNLGGRLHADPLPEPLLAPPRGARWHTLFGTEAPQYGGWGTPPIETEDDGWWLPAESATLLSSELEK